MYVNVPASTEVKDGYIVTGEEAEVVVQFLHKISGISEVLRRKQMKVAFFGR